MAALPSLQKHCYPCGFPEQMTADPRESSLASAAVLRYAWLLKHPDAVAYQEYVVATYQPDSRGDRYSRAARCAELIVEGECPLFKFIDNPDPARTIAPKEQPTLRLVT